MDTEYDISLKKGIANIEYDLTIDVAKQKQYEEELAKLDEEKEIVKLEKADDGNIYLQAGTYEIKISANGDSTSSSLKIK